MTKLGGYNRRPYANGIQYVPINNENSGFSAQQFGSTDQL